VIDYATFCQLQVLHREKHLTVAQIAAELELDPRSVAKWVAQSSYQKLALIHAIWTLPPITALPPWLAR